MTDSLSIKGPASDADWTVRYFDVTMGQAITSYVTAGGWDYHALAVGGSKLLRLTVKSGPHAAPGSLKSVSVTVLSLADNTRKDTVKATTMVASTVAPG